MTTLWRISRHRNLKGLGGLRESGRWHDRPRAVVYLAEHPALALLEVLAHLEIESAADLPDDYCLLEVRVPASVKMQSLSIKTLSEGWRDDETCTRSFGNRWYDGKRSALLRVPSALVPMAFNVVVNPTHRDARRIRVVKVHPVWWDPRLVKPN